MKNKKDWSEYYKITKTNPPSKLLVKAITHVTSRYNAIDIGGGALKDTCYLLNQGFEVTVVDKSPLMMIEAEKVQNEKLHPFVSSFEDFNFPENQFDIASSIFALPFTDPKYFDLVIFKIKQSVKKGGVFCGHFFGINDDWSTNEKMTFHTRDQIEKFFEGFQIIALDEIEEEGKTANGNPKHWHIFEVIAIK